ncbi:MAG: tyrosine--tRNA ligase [Victivallaceae bacterium]|nr:tyrosine--tRNA ligase [Victivallaceae bacterium]
MTNNNAYSELEARGFIYQATDSENINKTLATEKISFYVGFDPTGSSLHVGHLLPIMGMRLLQKAGHLPIVLVGGATALIGDPSGKQTSRPIISKAEVAANAEALKQQICRFISPENAEFVNNIDWFEGIKYIDFLRDVGSKFSVNRMLSAESVKMRLETGLSFLEFNYSILQAYDFYILNRDLDCKMQFGGQDQWGNIVAGTELVRRMSRNEVFALTFPLLLNSSGEKFGKTAGGEGVWLDRSRTSVFDYYQFWRNSEDTDVKRLLGLFTELPVAEIAELGQLEAPAINRAKEILAFEATKLAHGEAEATKAYLAAGSKFGFADKEGKIATSSSISKIKADSSAAADNLPTATIPASEFTEEGIWVAKLFSLSGLCKSNSDARRLIQGGGAYINDQRITDIKANITTADFQEGFAVLKAGKKNIRKVIIE